MSMFISLLIYGFIIFLHSFLLYRYGKVEIESFDVLDWCPLVVEFYRDEI